MSGDKQATELNVLVTGGSGFLGEALIWELLEKDSPLKINQIKIFDQRPPSINYNDSRVKFEQGDIREITDLKASSKGIDIIFHVAAIIDWGVRSDKEVYDVNVGGTENVISACKENKIEYLVYTSSLDAVYSGKPLINITEDQPYPEEHETSYCRSKYLSEEAVTSAHSAQLKTCILRPSDIYGEKDPYHIGSLIDMAKSGFYVRLGNGKSKCQHIYVRNMAFALIQAADTLLKTPEKVGGKVYFITEGTGSNFFSFFDQIVIGAGYRLWPKNLWLPRGFANFLATISELIAWLVKPIKKYNPKFSRFAVTYTCTDFTFNSEKAKNDFGFYPRFSKEQALKRTIDYYREDKLKN